MMRHSGMLQNYLIFHENSEDKVFQFESTRKLILVNPSRLLHFLPRPIIIQSNDPVCLDSRTVGAPFALTPHNKM